MKFKALEQLILIVVVQPRCVVGPRVSPAYFKLTRMRPMRVRVCPWTYAYTLAAIHAVNMRDKFENLTSSLTINAPLIVKDEVDKVFELILFATKQKII